MRVCARASVLVRVCARVPPARHLLLLRRVADKTHGSISPAAHERTLERRGARREMDKLAYERQEYGRESVPKGEQKGDSAAQINFQNTRDKMQATFVSSALPVP
eukprot:4478569-Pleurochrysis_carterae.AAC.9